MYTLKSFYGGSHRVIADLLEGNRAQFILDVGCDNGFVGKCLSYKPERLVGVDKRKLKPPLKNYSEIWHIDVEKESFPETPEFDVVILADILEHLKSPGSILTKSKTLLKKNGYFIVSLPNMDFLLVRLLYLFGIRPKASRGLFDRTHLHDFNCDSAMSFLKKNGLKIASVTYTQVPLPLLWRGFLGPINRLNGFLAKKFPSPFSYQIIIKAY